MPKRASRGRRCPTTTTPTASPCSRGLRASSLSSRSSASCACHMRPCACHIRACSAPPKPYRSSAS
eukprot:1288902-Prymnesium_polylepis.1